MQRVVILGGEGDGSVVAEALIQSRTAGRNVEAIGFLNDGFARGHMIYGLPVLGTLETWEQFDSDVSFVWALQRVGQMVSRVKRFSELGIPENRWISIRHPSAVVASTASVEVGSFIASCCTVQPMAKVGRFASMRAGVSVGHHAEIHDHAYVGPNATLCGYSVLETGACLGPNAVLLESTVVGAFGIVGIGSAVTKNVAPGTTVLGNPARAIRRLGQG